MFVFGVAEFLGRYEPGGLELSATITPIACIAWSLWLLTLGTAQIITRSTKPAHFQLATRELMQSGRVVGARARWAGTRLDASNVRLSIVSRATSG